MLSVSGPYLFTCLTISEPIDPPAPVTRTRLPRMNSAISVSSGCTGRRPNKFSSETSVMSPRRTAPETISNAVGITRKVIPSPRQRRSRSRSAAELIFEIATSSILASVALIALSSFSIPP